MALTVIIKYVQAISSPVVVISFPYLRNVLDFVKISLVATILAFLRPIGSVRDFQIALRYHKNFVRTALVDLLLVMVIVYTVNVLRNYLRINFDQGIITLFIKLQNID